MGGKGGGGEGGGGGFMGIPNIPDIELPGASRSCWARQQAALTVPRKGIQPITNTRPGYKGLYRPRFLGHRIERYAALATG